MRVAHWVNLYLYALVTGVFWGTWFSLSRSIETIAPQTFLDIGHTMIGNLGRPMSVLMPAAILANIVVAVMLFRRKQKGPLAFAFVALLLMLVALAATLAVNVPIDRQIQGWTVATVPVDWQAIRDRWETYHVLRTFASLVGFACACAAAVWPARQDA
jgi:uncharacterized membrane protein